MKSGTSPKLAADHIEKASFFEAPIYLILAYDGSSRMVLKRDSEEAAFKKAAELRDLGWFRVEVVPQRLTKAA